MPALYNFAKDILSQAKWQKTKQNKNRNRQIDKQGSIFMSTNIQKIIERGEENVLLVFSIKFYLQMEIYICVAKFDRRYLFHMIFRSL